MTRRPPRSTRTYTLFPYTTLFRSNGQIKLDNSNRGQTQGFPPDVALQPANDPRSWLPRAITARHAIPALGIGGAERVSRQGLRHGRRPAEGAGQRLFR